MRRQPGVASRALVKRVRKRERMREVSSNSRAEAGSRQPSGIGVIVGKTAISLSRPVQTGQNRGRAGEAVFAELRRTAGLP